MSVEARMAEQKKQANICVVGSSNMDLISRIPRLPKMGETLVGRSFQMGCGGKGANQAVMAAKLGGQGYYGYQDRPRPPWPDHLG